MTGRPPFEDAYPALQVAHEARAVRAGLALPLPPKTPIDEVATLARETAPLFLLLGADLFDAQRPMSRGLRAAALTSVFVTWPKICRAMSQLEQLAPRSADMGAEADIEAQELRAEMDARKAPGA